MKIIDRITAIKVRIKKENRKVEKQVVHLT